MLTKLKKLARDKHSSLLQNPLIMDKKVLEHMALVNTQLILL